MDTSGRRLRPRLRRILTRGWHWWWRRGILIAGAGGLGYWAYVEPVVLNALILFLRFALQLLFAITFVIIQFVAIFWFMSRSRVEVIKPGDPKQVTLADYWGQENLVRLVRQWIDLLSNRDRFVKMGGQFINGILLAGPPGTGKTMLAKAIAGEAGIPFISIEGSSFRSMFWGVDVLKMMWFVGKARKLAREYGACIAYIDEIDAVGASRGGVMGGERTGPLGWFGWGGTGALTRLLYEMDGITQLTRWERIKGRIYRLLGKRPPPRSWHVLFMGATNRPDALDPALVRPGRFDRIIYVDLPDRAGRREIIRGYLSKVKHDPAIDIESLVADTAWATPAKIMAAITKDAVRIALFNGRDYIIQRDIELALQEQAMGLENPIAEMDPLQRRQVAYHEAGHAVAQYYLLPDERIIRASLIRRTNMPGALGYVHSAPKQELYTVPLRRLVAEILVSLAGHVATKIFMGEHWTGAGADFQQVRQRIMILLDLGYFGFHPLKPEDPARYQDIIERFWMDCEEKVEQLLREHAAEVEAVAQALLERHDLSGNEVIAIIESARAGRSIPLPTPASASAPLAPRT
ncbi:AAA family ATPase [Thermoflexus sp.]|uniref:AAA family ATPase n=1 Tax=Thermoflexus sp. TaxID=1969742 RepID=UPI00260128EF|nr:AAA family ATPase [Thermoflexus sp.]MDW8180389.1 AAA family ATPase [Anaerolineae bacterium]MCS6963565.1 AAA family ATPase [Thermoflexus sp.]MCS7350938.1 AAA family ATPase [Thermoflexus sp.]MCX7691418.1 AAA family ATPase [Thermoflexus sp.]MDW8185246.1 AAA family ATPase [Anaerolineae bacterium]